MSDTKQHRTITQFGFFFCLFRFGHYLKKWNTERINSITGTVVFFDFFFFKIVECTNQFFWKLNKQNNSRRFYFFFLAANLNVCRCSHTKKNFLLSYKKKNINNTEKFLRPFVIIYSVLLSEWKKKYSCSSRFVRLSSFLLKILYTLAFHEQNTNK